MLSEATRRAVELILDERKRQDFMWPGQWKPGRTENGKKLAILVEENGEVARALYESDGKEDARVLEELVHTAAVALAWVESIIGDEGFLQRQMRLKRQRGPESLEARWAHTAGGEEERWVYVRSTRTGALSDHERQMANEEETLSYDGTDGE